MLFLEDLDFKRDEQVVEDITGIMEATLNAEVSWNHIMMESIQAEYTAIRNEDVALLEAAQGNWWTKVKQWFKDRFEDLKKFVKTVVEKIVSFFDFSANFVMKHKDTLRKFKGEVEVKVYEWKQDPMSSMSNNIDTIQSGSKPLTLDQVSQKVVGTKFENISKEIMEQTRKGNEPTSRKLGPNEVNAAAKVCMNAKTYKSDIKKSFESVSGIIQLGIRQAENGVKLYDYEKTKKSELKTLQNEISDLKNLSVVVNKVKSTVLSLANAYIKDQLKICKAAVAATKKGTNKVSKKDSKNESLDLDLLFM